MSDNLKVTVKDIRKIATLARLKLDDEEVLKFTDQFNKILDYMDQLNEVDTSNVEPLSHVLDLVNVSRSDEPEPALDRQVVLDNAPVAKNGYIAVPPVLRRRASGKRTP